MKDPLEISFAVRGGRLVLLARSTGCVSAEVPMRVIDDPSPNSIAGRKVVERAGTPVFGSNGCFGAGIDRHNWAYSFLQSSLRTSDAEAFGRNGTSIFFEYQGVAPIGQPQLPRNELKCVPAHVRPFQCGTYRSTRGSGDLAFLGTSPYRLIFHHVNGELEASFYGHCNGISTSLQIDGATVVALGGSETAMLCTGAPGKEDNLISHFFHGVLTFHKNGSTLTFTSAAGSATFTP